MRPDVLVKGADYRKDEVVGAAVRRIVRRPRPPGAAAPRAFDDELDRADAGGVIGSRLAPCRERRASGASRER